MSMKHDTLSVGTTNMRVWGCNNERRFLSDGARIHKHRRCICYAASEYGVSSFRPWKVTDPRNGHEKLDLDHKRQATRASNYKWPRTSLTLINLRVCICASYLASLLHCSCSSLKRRSRQLSFYQIQSDATTAVITDAYVIPPSPILRRSCYALNLNSFI